MFSLNEVCPFDGETISDLIGWCNENTPGLFTGYYPADLIDLWPALMLQKHDYCRELLLVMPIGRMGWAHNDLEQQMIRFCDTGSIEATGDLHRWTAEYGYSVKRIVPLSPVTEEPGRRCLDLRHLGCFRAAHIQMSHSEFADVHLLILEADPNKSWSIQSEFYNPFDILIESGKGMGNWFTGVPLYGSIARGPHDRIPRYYMKGKYMSYEGPKGTYTECDEYESPRCGIATEIRKVDPFAFKCGYLSLKFR